MDKLLGREDLMGWRRRREGDMGAPWKDESKSLLVVDETEGAKAVEVMAAMFFFFNPSFPCCLEVW